MTRTNRLLTLLQHLRDSRRAITAQTLAETLGISLRTLYRDIETLRAQGADIRGGAGTGYLLHRTDFLLPPLTFDAAETEALVFGMRSAVAQGDDDLAEVAWRVINKIRDVLSEEWRDRLAAQAVYPLVAKVPYRADEARILPRVRHALRSACRLHIHYTDAKGESTRRTIWPLALGYFEDARLLAAWCELRGDFRHFRCERITSADPGKPYPVPHTDLLRRWQAQEEVDLFKRYGF